jgi:hypothetical protein
VYPAPRREPPFDDELPSYAHRVGPLDQPLPFTKAVREAPVPVEPPSVRAGLPDPARWGRALLVGLIETASGRRPLQQLAALVTASVGFGLRTDFERCAQLGQRHWTHSAVVGSVRASEPADGIAELCATLRVGPRTRAVAMRLEVQYGRWKCTRLQLG